METLAEAIQRGSSGMRCQGHIRQGQQGLGRIRWLLLLGIEAGAENTPPLQRVDQSWFVYHFPTTGIDQDRLGFHAPKDFSTDHMARAVVQGHV
jgi:hypothetical protein